MTEPVPSPTRMTSVPTEPGASGPAPDAGGGDTDRGLVSRIGPIEIDWPRSLGYFGAAAAAVALEIVEPPLGLFIAAIPFLKMLNKSKSSRPIRFVAQVLDGASKPVGGDGEGTVRYSSPKGGTEQQS